MSSEGKKDDAFQEPQTIEVAPKLKDVEIEVVDDTPPQDKDRPKRDPKAPLPKEDPFDGLDPDLQKYLRENNLKAQKRIKELTFEFHNQRREREQAERLRDEAVRVAQQWQQQQRLTEGQLVQRQAEHLEQTRAQSENTVQLAQQNLASALEQGKPEEIAKAQTSLTRAVAQQEKLPSRAVVQPQQQPVQQQPQPQQDWRQSQQVAQQPQPQASTPDPKAVKWFQDNAWFGNDEPMTGYAYGLHEKLIKTGVHPQSDEYYEEINKGMRKVFPDQFEDEGGESPPAARPNPVAPPARGTAPRKVQLTATQASLAKRLGITLEQYAAQLIKEQKANG